MHRVQAWHGSYLCICTSVILLDCTLHCLL